MDALGKLMKIAKIGKTLNRVVLVLSVAIIIIVSVIFMLFLAEAESSGEKTISLTADGTETVVRTNEIVLYFLAVILYLVKSIYSSNICLSYFSLVVRQKTPFRPDAAIELGRLGIVAVVFPAINNIITVVFRHFITSDIFSSSLIINYNPLPSFALGVMFFVCSAVSHYGAEVSSNKKKSE